MNSLERVKKNHRYYENHKEEIKNRVVIYKKTHKEHLNKAIIINRQKLKIEVFDHYCHGTPCCQSSTCSTPGGCRDIRVLSIDHIDGSGAIDRKRFKKGMSIGTNFYYWLRNNGYPKGYQVLCMNCQWIKRYENKEYMRRIN